MEDEIRIFPIGDSALTIEFGDAISPELNRRAIALSDYLIQHPFPGFIETVPAYASVSVFYDPLRVLCPGFSTPFDNVRENVLSATNDASQADIDGRTIEIPVRFDDGPDLKFVAGSHGLTPNEVIEIFTSTIYRVYMLGFLPGFTYMGEVDERIATPRRETPRTVVKRGSVGIAGKQTGIYSLDSPGGWQVIGVTDLEIFTPYDEQPTLLRPGDQVTFTRVR
jgi:inhibitor of KinA